MGDLSIDTIVAVATPAGRGGIGVVRLSGPEALEIAAGLVRAAAPLDHAQARFARVLDPSNAAAPPIDEALVTAFHGPHSYTGETVVEIAAHGSPVVLGAIVRAALAKGARLAGPGEFTQRAFLAGRLDLTQAEAVGDLISAQTLEAARVAAQQLGGALSRRVAPVKAELVHLIALLEAGMDFASGELDDVDVVAPAEIEAQLLAVRAPLLVLSVSFRHAELLRNGASLALVGLPNAGKSSLFNRLLGRDRAIVTAAAGTTRDTIEEAFSIRGIPVRLIDTAGLRDITVAAAASGLSMPVLDEAEALGIARSREALADADAVLLVHDATQPLTEDELAVLASLHDRPHLLLLNKTDLVLSKEASPRPVQQHGPSPHAPAASSMAWGASVALSARTGEGMETLQQTILQVLDAGAGLAGAGSLSNLRQRQAITAALGSVGAAMNASASGLPHELLLLDLHDALRALDSLTGTTTTEDILAQIFSTFCIGK